MHFANVNPADVIFGASWFRGNPQARRADGARVQVQTPQCSCRVSLAGSGSYRIDMTLRPDVASHRDFGAWIAAVEDRAVDATQLDEWKKNKSMSSTVFRDNLRFMAFSDTTVFDESGALSNGLMDAVSCSALVELQGCWGTDSRWGLRWKVVQLKFSTSPPTFPIDDSPTTDDDENAGDDSLPFAFLD